MKTARVLSVGIAAADREILRDAVSRMLRGDETASVAKVNAEFLLRSLTDKDFREYLSSTSLNIADGIGVLWAARYLTLGMTKYPVLRQLQATWQAAYSLLALVVRPSFCRVPIPERIPGVDSLMLMLEAAADTGSAVYFLGATTEINEKARAEIHKRLPRLTIAGGLNGYADDWEPVLGDIERSEAALLIVALGCPKQEFWIRDYAASLPNVRVAVGEGGSLDFLAGEFRRAPVRLQALGLEWFWRLFMNPNKSGSGSRARRIWNAVPVFVYQTIRWKLQHGSETLDHRPEPEAA